MRRYCLSPERRCDMQNRRPIPPRRSATIDAHRAGHSSHIHPEDEPYWTTQQNTYPNPLDLADQLDFQEEPKKSRTSAYYYPTTGKQQVIRQGNREVVFHKGR